MGEVNYNEKKNPFLLQVWEVSPVARLATKNFHRTVYDKLVNCKVRGTFLEILMQGKKPLVFLDVASDFEKMGGFTITPPVETLLGIPFIVSDEVKGIIGLANRKQGYGKEVLDSLALISSICASLVDEGHSHKKAETQRIQREAVLTAASEAKSNFVANVSHEIRTPLTNLLGMLDLINTSYLHEEDKSYLKTAQECGAGFLTIINDILDLSKIEAKQLTFETILFSPPKIILELKKLLIPQAKKKGLILNFKVNAQVPEYVMGDPTRLRQILTNLISNAVKFTEKGTITCHLSGHYESNIESPFRGNFILEGSVTDTGIGMSPKTQKRLFKPFTQGDESITRRFGGTGLGLYITKQLCELMGGGLSFTSELNKGSTFHFNICMPLPLSPQEVGVFKLEAEQSYTDLPPLKVLIAEDNIVTQKILKTILTREGCTVRLVSNGFQALEAAQEEPYDMMLMDGQMPDMDGIEATQQIRKIFDSQTLPIIGVTAHAMLSDRERFLASGMNGYLAKPIEKESLKKEILRCLRER